MNDRLQPFLAFSVEITAFTRFELLGTGQAEAYLAAVEKVVGPVLRELLDAYENLPTTTDRKTALRRQIFGDEKLGPIARAITKLWYIGIWYELPRSWTQSYGALPNNVTFMVSPASYAEGLLWPAIGAHPPGAKAPGYASWVAAPDIPEFEAGAPSDAAPKVTQSAPGHLSPTHASTPQHPPPAQGT